MDLFGGNMLLKNQSRILILISLLLISPPLYSEVLEVFVSWNNSGCKERCAELLHERFEKMPQVESVTMNPSAGNARLKWNPTSPFSYQVIKNQLQRVGVGLNELRVRVRGRGVPSGKGVSLISLGDNTRFTLISHLRNRPEKYISRPDGSKLDLSSNLQEKILNAAQEDKAIVIEGPIYQPHRSPPLYLVVSRLQIEKKKGQKNERTH